MGAVFEMPQGPVYMGFPKIGACIVVGPENKGYSTWGANVGSHIDGTCHVLWVGDGICGLSVAQDFEVIRI